MSWARIETEPKGLQLPLCTGVSAPAGFRAGQAARRQRQLFRERFKHRIISAPVLVSESLVVLSEEAAAGRQSGPANMRDYDFFYATAAVQNGREGRIDTGLPVIAP